MVERINTISEVYDNFSQAERVVSELQASGIGSEAISLIGMNDPNAQFAAAEDVAVAGAGVGAAMGGSAGLLAGLGVLAIPGLGPIVAAGWLAASATCAVAGAAAGGLIGALIGTGIEEADAQIYAEIVRRGGTIVSVRANESHEPRVRQIMDRLGPVNIAERAASYRANGWSPSLAPGAG